MTQDEIISSRTDVLRMAREACSPHQILNTDLVFLERFVALVAAHEREKCAEICDYFAGEWEWDTDTAVGLATRIREIK